MTNSDCGRENKYIFYCCAHASARARVWGPFTRWSVKDHYHVAVGPRGPLPSCCPVDIWAHQACVVPPFRASPRVVRVAR